MKNMHPDGHQDICWGIDKPVIFQHPVNVAFGSVPVFSAHYRRWTIFVLVHTVDGKLVGSLHGILVHSNAESRHFDITARSQFEPRQMQQYLREVCGLIQAQIDDGWRHEPRERQEEEAAWEAHMREMKQIERQKPPHERAPWLAADLN